MRKLRCSKGIRHFQAYQTSRLREPSNLITRGHVTDVLTLVGQNRQSVCFTGHRYIAASEMPALVSRLDALLELCYRHGYRDFFCGGALGFDMLAAERVLALQNDHAGIRLVLVIPCSDQMNHWPEQDVARYERILYAADDIRVLSPFYYDGCMQVRNRYMVDRSSLCICYMRHHKGGTASTVAYAVKEQVAVLNAAMENVCAAFPKR
ncbi:MAG: DUF1273 family protein [Christensenellaceae bacterium]|nr:DUF1273 family protein [Christensenellaceae bacterium]